MSTPSKKRLIRDFKRLSTDPPGGISGAPCADNLMIWNAVIFGPADTPFEDGTFKLVLTFDESYPNKRLPSSSSRRCSTRMSMRMESCVWTSCRIGESDVRCSGDPDEYPELVA